MKAFIVSLVAILSFSAFAQIEGSSFEKRHQKLIRDALTVQCDVPTAWLIQVSNKTTSHEVDQGIIDYKYVTEIEVEGNGIVTVLSSYSDHYDHADQAWGSYSIDAIKGCY